MQTLRRGAPQQLSARIPGTQHTLIKAKGPDEEAVEFASERDGIRIEMRGAVVEAPASLTPPNETAMHLAIYRVRPEVMRVIHSRRRGAPRDGRGLARPVVCGRCRRKMTVRYGEHQVYQCRREQMTYGEPGCQYFPISYRDPAVRDAFFAAI